MRKVILSIIAALSFSWAYTQQETQYSNYQMNNFLLNPAVAGSYIYSNARVGCRLQWLGIEGAPRTYFASVQGPIKEKQKRSRSRRNQKNKPHHGIGLTTSSDKVGAFSYFNFSGTYAAHLPVNKVWTLSLGASLGLKQTTINTNNLHFQQNAVDPSIVGGVYSEMNPDANLGGWLYSDVAFIGVSARQILQSDINIALEMQENEYSRLYNHYYITGGIKHQMNADWSIVPSIMIQSVRPAPLQVDLNTTFWYQNKLGFGLSYRHLDAIYATVEYLYDNLLEIGYAYDLTISQLTRYNSGTHEIIIGIRWPRAPQVLCPAKFW